MSTLNDKQTRCSFHDLLSCSWYLRDALSDRNDISVVGILGNVYTLPEYMDAKTIGYDIMIGFVI